MDHARLNCFVVDERARLPRGRPWLTVCVDLATRCILGFHITFDPPSHMSVARCLRQAVLPKVGLRERYSELKHDWECYGAIEQLVVDNGQEFHGHALEDMAAYMGTDLEYMPRRTPWFKGVVERLFGTVDQKLFAGLPGYTFRSIAEREDYDPEKHAVLTMETLQELLTRWVVDDYHQTVHSAIDKTPAQAWRDLEHTIERGLPINAADLDLRLGKTVERTLDHRGVMVSRIWYNSEALAAMRIDHGAKLRVTVVWDTDDLGSVSVFDPSTKQPIEVRALRRDYAAGLSEWQHKRIRRRAKAEGRRHADIDTLMEVKAELVEIVTAALEDKRGRRRGRATRESELATTAPPKAAAKTPSRRKTSKAKPDKDAKQKGASTGVPTGSSAGAGHDTAAPTSTSRPRGRSAFKTEAMPGKSGGSNAGRRATEEGPQS